MATLSAYRAADWGMKLAQIVTALDVAEKSAGFSATDWAQIYSAKLQATDMLGVLLHLTCADVAIEPAASLERAA